MKLRLYPRKLYGHVTPPPSKSLLHREMIAQALSGEAVTALTDADDIQRTAQALRRLQKEQPGIIDCGDSGSTLRFLLPVAMVLGRVGTRFTGSPRLMARPIPPLSGWERRHDGIVVTAPLHGGVYSLSGNETSQLISGLLMALPLCQNASEIRLTTPLVSRPYVDMTCGVLRRHHIAVEQTATGWYIPGSQRCCAAPVQTEADWSAAAWFYVLRSLGCSITVDGLYQDTLQGDAQIRAYCTALPDTADVSQTPDLLPPLALLAALQPEKVTRFTGAAFLRGKESDRLAATAQVLCALGGQAEETADGLIVTGVSSLRGGTVDSGGDHRIAMLAGCAAAYCTAPVELIRAECVAKSYPHFWEDYVALHGEIEVMET